MLFALFHISCRQIRIWEGALIARFSAQYPNNVLREFVPAQIKTVKGIRHSMGSRQRLSVALGAIAASFPWRSRFELRAGIRTLPLTLLFPTP